MCLRKFPILFLNILKFFSKYLQNPPISLQKILRTPTRILYPPSPPPPQGIHNDCSLRLVFTSNRVRVLIASRSGRTVNQSQSVGSSTVIVFNIISLLLLLQSPTIWFPLDRKWQSHKRSWKKINVLILLALVVLHLWLCSWLQILIFTRS